MKESEQNWYVINTLPRWEKKVAMLLSRAGYENYCPLNKVQKQWSDRKKIVDEPLFKGYVFVKTYDKTKFELLNFKGIINFVFYLGKPGVVREAEIETIKKFLFEFENVSVENNGLMPSDEVIINQGVLMNYKGIVMEVCGRLAKVQIEGLGCILIATFSQKHLDLLNKTEKNNAY